MPILTLQGIQKSLNGQHVLRGVDLSLGKGETLVVMGQSGGGKSVTLRVITGLIKPDAGSVVFDGTDLVPLPEEKLNPFRKRIGMLFQDGALFDSMDVEENLAFPLREERRWSRKEINDRVAQALELVDLSPHGRKMPNELSGGMRKRVGLARAAIRRPELMLYDEPTSGLDPVVSDSINHLILRLRDKLGVSSIVVTHDMSSANTIADRIAFLREGAIYFEGTPADIAASTDRVVRDFVEGRSQSPEAQL